MTRVLKQILMLSLSACAAVVAFAAPIQETKVEQQDGKVKVEITIKQDGKKTEDGKAPFTGTRPAVDLAILLDTSNSMDGLISQAKSQLWLIVQQFAQAQRAGKTPLLRVSVFEYGNTNLPASEGYIRQVCGLTDDLDEVSAALFGLKTQGGDEYCGMVIDESLKRLDWSNEPNSYKAIFIAGNEPFTQGTVDYRDACKRAIEAGVRVNTIHCGSRQAGVDGKWEDGAKIAEGEFLNIDQDIQVAKIECPQDKIIIELNMKLNKTYLWYGAKRGEFQSNQIQQDSNAAQSGGLVERAIIKGSAPGGGKVYLNRGRDLVDTIKENQGVLREVDVKDLPDEMQSMSETERLEHVNKMAKERADIEKQLAKVIIEREEHLAKLRATDPKAVKTLGDAMIETVRKQLADSGFEFNDR